MKRSVAAVAMAHVWNERRAELPLDGRGILAFEMRFDRLTRRRMDCRDILMVYFCYFGGG